MSAKNKLEKIEALMDKSKGRLKDAIDEANKAARRAENAKIAADEAHQHLKQLEKLLKKAQSTQVAKKQSAKKTAIKRAKRKAAKKKKKNKS